MSIGSDAPLTPEQIAKNEAIAAREGYFHRVLVGFDQFWNVAFGGLPDETISSRAERDAKKHEILAVVLTRGLDILQQQHGEKAEAGDTERSAKVLATESAALKE